MEYGEAKERLIQTWGALGPAWGINRTMAQIHALLLITPGCMTAEEVMAGLCISRGNANTNLRALMDWGLVHKELRPGDRKDYYRAEKDMQTMALQILKERYRREVEPLAKALEQIRPVDGQAIDENSFELMRVVEGLRGMVDQLEQGMRIAQSTGRPLLAAQLMTNGHS